MKWLAKINLTTFFLRFGAFRSALLIVVMLTLFAYIGYRGGNYYHGYQQQTLAQQQTRLETLYAEQEKLVKQIHALDVELEVERMANHKAQSLLKAIEAEHFQVKKELAFYEKVMAPEKQADGLIIDTVLVSPTESLNHYRFQVVLVQQKRQKRYAKGYIELKFTGSQANKSTQLSLTEVSTLTKEALTFNFQYFQILEGEFTLPADFIPEQLAVAAILPKSKWQKYHRLDESYQWQLIAKNNDKSLPVILD